jgi:hypothetical protein
MMGPLHLRVSGCVKQIWLASRPKFIDHWMLGGNHCGQKLLCLLAFAGEELDVVI